MVLLRKISNLFASIIHLTSNLSVSPKILQNSVPCKSLCSSWCAIGNQWLVQLSSVYVYEKKI